MENENRNLQIDGKAVNVAQGAVSVNHQHVDQSKEHEINQNHQTSVVINNQYDKSIYGPRMVPADPAASFIDQLLLRAIILAQSDDIRYDDRVGSHVRAEQADRLTEYIASLWDKTSPAEESLNTSIRKFRMQATIGGVEINSTILKCLNELAQIFFHAEDYLALCASRTLNKSLHEDTVHTFGSLVTLLKTLLEYAWRGNRLNKTQKQDIADQTDELRTSLFEMNINAKNLKNPIRANDLNTYHSGDLGLYVLRNLKTFLNSGARQSPIDDIPYRRKDTRKENIPRETNDGPSPATVAVQYLAYDQSQVIQDFEEAASPSNIDSEEMRQISALTKREEFKKWLQENNKATKLLIHGGLEGGGTLSGLSYLCARIPMEYLRKTRSKFICLHYFCSLQRSRRDSSSNAYDIARSLCGQLLTNSELSSDLDLSFLDKRWLQKVLKQDFKATCQLLLRLLKQLDRKKMTIFCFIDSISLYETGSLYRNTERLFSSLEEYSKSQRRSQRGKSAKLIFKLLVTDAMTTSYVHKYFRGAGEMIDMDGGDERDDNNDDVDLDVLYG
ncbi:hypothetical protein F5Y11DRAFT_347362 [Daldinia sp. FL1419]|nr:hypothetical protein F5Y11DRAFT_347362 [Daldinia sp. FL1419]